MAPFSRVIECACDNCDLFRPVLRSSFSFLSMKNEVTRPWLSASMAKNLSLQSESAKQLQKKGEDIKFGPITLDTFTKGDPDIGPHLFKAFRPIIIGPIYNRVMKIELEIGGVTI